MFGTDAIAGLEELETNPWLLAPLRGPWEARFEELKRELLQPVIESISDAKLLEELSWAANEAAAIAWFTGCSILVLPTLLEEKVRGAMKRWEKQEQLRSR